MTYAATSFVGKDKSEISSLYTKYTNHRFVSRGIGFAIVLYGPTCDMRHGEGRSTRYESYREP
jgi:hypothetical protein